MITGELRSRVDRIWDTMWSGGISNPLSVIEQLTYLLFIKRLDELQTVRENKAARTKKPIEEPVFTADQDKLRWSRFKEAAPEQMFELLRDDVFPFMKTLGQKGEGDGEGGSTYTHHMKDALFMMPTARVLANVVDQLDSIDMADSDTKGDLYEYMLGKIAIAGQNGQFRTPRHIIKLMVDMTAPSPKDVICDPACGTAGFLIAASESLVEHHSDTIYKNAAARRRFNDHTFHGYDFDSTMLRIGSMNMLLHGVENPDIRYRDSLAQADDDDAEKYSVVLANPPFAGSLDYESTAKDLQQIVKPGFPFCRSDQGLSTPTRLSARQISSAHVMLLPTPVSLGPRSTGNRLEPLLSGHFSDTAPHVCPFFATASLHSAARQPAGTGSAQDPPQHVAEQPPGQMPFRQQEPVVPGMLHQPASGFHQPLLETRERPALDPRRQDESAPEVAQVVGQDTQLQAHFRSLGNDGTTTASSGWPACLP